LVIIKFLKIDYLFQVRSLVTTFAFCGCNFLRWFFTLWFNLLGIVFWLELHLWWLSWIEEWISTFDSITDVD